LDTIATAPVVNDAALRILEQRGVNTDIYRIPAQEAGAADATSVTDNGQPLPAPGVTLQEQPKPTATQQSATDETQTIPATTTNAVTSPENEVESAVEASEHLATAATSPVEVDDAAVKRFLEKKYGKSIDSLDDLVQPKQLTPEEQAAQAEKIRGEAMAYGIKQQLFTRKELEQYHADAAKSPRDISFEVFGNQMKKNDPSATQEDIADAFSQYFYEHEEDGHPLKEMQKAAMQTLHDNYLATKYSNILSVDNEYNSFQQQQATAADYGRKLDNIFQEFGNGKSAHKMEFPVGDATYTYQVKPETVAEIMQQYKSVEMFNSLGDRATDAAMLKSMLEATILHKEFNNILAEVAESHSAKMKLQYEAQLAAVPQRSVSGGTPTNNTGSTVMTPDGPAAAILRQQYGYTG